MLISNPLLTIASLFVALYTAKALFWIDIDTIQTVSNPE